MKSLAYLLTLVAGAVMLRRLFSCQHHNYTRPMTINGKCCVTCLECGHRLNYSWQRMKVVA